MVFLLNKPNQECLEAASSFAFPFPEITCASDDAMLQLHHPGRSAELLGAMRGRDGQAQPRFCGCNDRRADRLGEDPVVEQRIAQPHRPSRVADDDRQDLGRRRAHVEPSIVQRRPQRGGVDPQALDAVMGVLDDLRRGGRVVGLISHVEELRTRIPARIEVVAGRHGSRLAG